MRFIFFAAIFFLPFGGARAQLCQGSLGDPIINITFGSGTNPGASLAAATTNYQYSGADCPNDGLYTVRTSSLNCFGNSWHNLTADHTGNPNGYFMLVNSSVLPSAFYLETVRGLCGNTTYEFAAWIVNMLLPGSCNNAGIKPNLTFRIERTDGTLLQSYNSGDIASTSNPTWRQFGFFFTTPSNVSDVVLRIINNATGGCGNDLALDDITFRACGPKLTPVITVNNSAAFSFCEGTATSLMFSCGISPGFASPLFQWQTKTNNGAWIDIPGETSLSLSQNFPASLPAGVYAFRLAAAEAGNMASQQCRVTSEPLTVTIYANPVATIIGNGPLCAGKTLTLTASGGQQYLWTGPNGFAANGASVSVNNIQSVQAGTYFTEVIAATNCKANAQVDIEVYPKPTATTTFNSTMICKGSNVQLIANGGDTYKWIPATGLSASDIANPFASPADTTAYQVITFNQFACTDTAEVLVNVVDRPVSDAGPDKYILDVPFVELSGKAYGQSIRYAWTPPVYIDNPGSLHPVVQPPRDTSYVLEVESTLGCGIATDTMHVFVFKDIFVPTAFSPNNDGLNDTWTIPGLNAFTEYEISVFNRQGQLVYYTKDTPKQWNGMYHGQPQPAGVYVYSIKLKGKRGVLKGTLMLVR